MTRYVAAAIVLLAILPALAGCIGPDERPGAAGEALEELALAAQGCDRPLLDERVRAREFDIATDPNDPSHLVATMMVPWPTQYALAPYDGMGWSGLAQSEDGGRTWVKAALPALGKAAKKGGWATAIDATGEEFDSLVIPR